MREGYLKIGFLIFLLMFVVVNCSATSTGYTTSPTGFVGDSIYVNTSEQSSYGYIETNDSLVVTVTNNPSSEDLIRFFAVGTSTSTNIGSVIVEPSGSVAKFTVTSPLTLTCSGVVCTFGNFYAKYGSTVTYITMDTSTSPAVYKHFRIGGVPSLIADFNISMTDNGVLPSTVTFTDTSQGNPVSYYWQMNWSGSNWTDTSNPSSVGLQLNEAGTYTVNHTVWDAAGTSSTISKTFTVVNPAAPTANFNISISNDAVIPCVVTLTDTSTGTKTDLNWSMNWGGILWTDTSNPASLSFHSSIEAGTYSVTHYAINGPVSSSITKTFTLSAPANITPTANVTAIATLATIPTGVGEIVNSTNFRSSITSTSIGNLTGPYLDLVDSGGNAAKTFGLSVISILVIPFSYITPNIQYALDLVSSLIIEFASFGHWILVALGIVIAGLPLEVQGLVTYGLVCQILILAIKGNVKVT